MAIPIGLLCHTYGMDTNAHREYVLYLRKSIGRAGISRQRTTTTAHIERQGGVIVDEFADADRTAYRKPGAAQPERERFGAMLDYLAAHPGVGIAAWHADRLQRDPADTTALEEACRAGGHMIETVGGGSYDLSTATGRKRLWQDAIDARYEVDHGRERCLAAKVEAVAEGKDLGGRRRFGWDRVASGELNDRGKPTTKLILATAEAELIRKGTADTLAGVSLAEVTRRWNRSGVLTSTGRPWRTREVSRVLCRARNAGLMEHNGEVTGPGDWPAIVTEDEWRACRSILTDPERRTSPGSERRWLCSGIALCGICGCALVCTTGGRRVNRPVYRCRAGEGGVHVGRDARTLDAFVAKLVIASLSEPDAVFAEPSVDVVALETERIALRSELDDLAEDVGARLISARQMRIASAPLNARLEELAAQLSAARRPGVLAPFRDAQDPWAVWDGLTLAQQRGIVEEQMFITVFPAGKGRPAGWTPGSSYFDPSTIRINWRDSA